MVSSIFDVLSEYNLSCFHIIYFLYYCKLYTITLTQYFEVNYELEYHIYSTGF